MKMIKILGMILAIAVMYTASSAHADYTVELKNETGSVIKMYTITTNQVAHLQKTAALTDTSVLNQFENAITNLIQNAKLYNKAMWQRSNEAYIEEQSRLP